MYGPSIHPRPSRNCTNDRPPVRTAIQFVQPTVDADLDNLESGRGEQDRNDTCNEESNFDQHNHSGSNFQVDKEEILLQNGACCTLCNFTMLAIVIGIYFAYVGPRFSLLMSVLYLPFIIGVPLLIFAVILNFYIFVSAFDVQDKFAMIVAAGTGISSLASMISYICLVTSGWTTWAQILFLVFTSIAMVLSLVLACKYRGYWCQ